MAVSAEVQEKMLEEAISATPTFQVDTNDPQFKEIEDYYDQRETDVNTQYGDMIANNPYAGWEEKLEENKQNQENLANEQLNQTLNQIDQQREQTQKDYIKEQSAAYVDWQKQSNPYGVNAEQMASQGLANSGYSESSQVAMYNQYQNRIATARESLKRAELEYANMSAEARRQNSELLQQIADSFLEKSMSLAIEGALYNNNLILELSKRQDELRAAEQAEYNTVYDRLWAEESMKADIWKYQDNQKFTAEQADLDRQHQLNMQEIDQKFEAKENQLNREHDAAQAQLDREHESAMLTAKNDHEKEMATIDYNNKVALLDKETEEKKELLAYEAELAREQAREEFAQKIANSTYYGVASSQGRTASGNGSMLTNGSSLTSGSGTKTTSNTSTSGKYKYPINMQSVKNLGYPDTISAAQLAQMERDGFVESYVKNGQTYFRAKVVLPTQALKDKMNGTTFKAKK